MTSQQLLERIGRVKKFKVGRTPVVVLPLEDYDALREQAGIYSSEALKKEIAEARKERKLYSSKQVKKKLGL